MALFASLSAHGRRFGAHLKTFFWGGASHYRCVPRQRKWVALGASLCDNDSMVTNSTIETLLNRRSIRKFVAEPIRR